MLMPDCCDGKPLLSSLTRPPLRTSRLPLVLAPLARRSSACEPSCAALRTRFQTDPAPSTTTLPVEVSVPVRPKPPPGWPIDRKELLIAAPASTRAAALDEAPGVPKSSVSPEPMRNTDALPTTTPPGVKKLEPAPLMSRLPSDPAALLTKTRQLSWQPALPSP